MTDASDIYAFTTPLLERVKFYNYVQEGEDINEFLLKLKELAMACEFGGFYNEIIRDRFVLGMKDTETRDILLHTRNLTLEKAEDIALARKVTMSKKKSRSGDTALANGSTLNTNSSAPCPTSPHTSMPGTSYDAVISFEGSPSGNTQACLTALLNFQPIRLPEVAPSTYPNENGQNENQSSNISSGASPILPIQPIQPSTQEAPSTSHKDNLNSPNEKQSSVISSDKSSIITIKSPDGKKIFACSHCDKKFNNKSLLKNHLPKHSSEKNHECKFCHKKYKSQGGVKYHEPNCAAKQA